MTDTMLLWAIVVLIGLFGARQEVALWEIRRILSDLDRLPTSKVGRIADEAEG